MREGMCASVMCFGLVLVCLLVRSLIHSLALIASGHCLPSCLITPSPLACI